MQQGQAQGPMAPPPASVLPAPFQPADVAAGGALGARAGLATAARIAGETGAMGPLQALAEPLTRRIPETVDPIGRVFPDLSAPIPARWLAEQAVGLVPGLAGEAATSRLGRRTATEAVPRTEAPAIEPAPKPEPKAAPEPAAPQPEPSVAPPPPSTEPALGSTLKVGGRDMRVVGHDATHVSVESETAAGRTTMRLPKSFFGSQRGAIGNIGNPEETMRMAERMAGSPELPPRAGNINLSRINSSDDVKRALVSVSEANKDFMAERRGVISLQEQERLASELGFRPKDLLKRKTGEAFNAEKAIAARQLLAQSGGDLVGLAKKAMGGSEYDLVAFQRALTRHTAIQEEVAGMTAEAGRALGSFRVAVGGGEAGTARQTAAIRSVLTQAGGRERIETIASHIAGLDDPARINRYVRQARHRSTGRLFWLYLNSLLSNPVTWSVKTLSDAASNLTNIADTTAASLVGKVHGGEKIYAREAASQAVSTVMGVQDAFKAAWHTMRTGEQAMGGGVVETRPIEGVTGNIVGFPVRVLKTIDEFWKTIAFRQTMHASATREGLQQGLRGPALRQFIDEYLTHPPDKAVIGAENLAHYLTQTRPLGAHARAVSRLVEETPGMKFLVPFRRVPINLIKFAVEHSTAAPLLGEVRSMLAAGGTQRDLALGRMAVGSGIGAWAVWHALNNNITGGGPVDPRERATWMLNHQPYSIRAGDKWVSYQRIEPIAFILGTAADYADLSKQAGTKEADLAKIAGRMVLSITRDLASKTYLRTLTELAQVMSDPNGRYAARFAATLLSSPIPAGLSQVARTQDPFQRETRSIVDAMRAKIPGLREQLPVRQDVLGRPETQEGAIGPGIASPFYVHGISGDPVVGELGRLNIGLSKPRGKVYEQLAPNDMADFMTRRGKIATQYIGNLMKAPWYHRLTDEQQRKYVKRQFKTATIQARAQMAPQFAKAAKAAAMKQNPEPRDAPIPVP